MLKVTDIKTAQELSKVQLNFIINGTADERKLSGGLLESVLGFVNINTNGIYGRKKKIVNHLFAEQISAEQINLGVILGNVCPVSQTRVKSQTKMHV